MKKHSKPIWNTESIIFATFLKNPMWQSKKFNHNDHHKKRNNKKWNFLGIIEWHTQQIQQHPEDETKSDKPIQGLKLLYGHEWLLTLFLSLSLCLQLSLSASLPLSLHPSRSLYISSYFYLLLLYSLFYISLFKNDTILKKSKNDRKDSFKGRLVFSSNQYTWIKPTYI